MMQFLRVLAKTINVSAFVVLFLLATTFALTPSRMEGSGFVGYFNFNNLFFYAYYLLFGIALLQYTRNRNIGWHNFFLSLVWAGVCWMVIVSIIFYPFIDQMFQEAGGPEFMKVQFIEFIMQITNEIQTSDEVPGYLYDYLRNLIIAGNIAILLAIAMAIPALIYGLHLLLETYLSNGQNIKWLIIGSVAIVVAGIALTGATLFGGITTELAAVYRLREQKPLETNFSFREKVDNLQFAWQNAGEFISQINVDPIAITSVLAITLLLILSITNKSLNTNAENLNRWT
jgi:hypothetical protein